jgi:acetyl esterase/lipase
VSFSYDPEFDAVFAPLAAALTANPAPAGDWKTLRETGDAGLALLAAGLPEVAGAQRTDVELPGYEGARLAARLFQRAGAEPPGSAILYIHGGGMVLGSMELYDKVPARYVAETGVPMLSVDYRLAPENPHPVPVEDCFAALTWLHEHAGDYGIDPARIGVMGDSAGGGLAAATAIVARDRGLPLARQILIYPMLDDRNVQPDPELVPFAVWTYDGNVTGWGALLGDRRGTDDVPPSAAPARETNFAGLPAAYIEVGELDIFRDEDVEYAQQLARAGVSAELHVHTGVPHGFDAVAGDSDLGRRSRDDRVRVIKSL